MLQAEAADAGDKARALAGLAMCALIDEPPNLATAKELVANAKQVRRGGSGVPASGGQHAGTRRWDEPCLPSAVCLISSQTLLPHVQSRSEGVTKRKSSLRCVRGSCDCAGGAAGGAG